MEYIQVGDIVVANRDIHPKKVKKGDKGIVTEVVCIDSDFYLNIKLSEVHKVYCSNENCWNKVEQ